MTVRSHVVTSLIVFVGGTFGTCLRALLTVPSDASQAPWIMLGINILGAGLLGMLVGITGAPVDARARRRHAFLSVGLLGGFTSYSALAIDTVMLSLSARPWLAIVTLTATLAGGLVASLVGIVGGRVIRANRARA